MLKHRRAAANVADLSVLMETAQSNYSIYRLGQRTAHPSPFPSSTLDTALSLTDTESVCNRGQQRIVNHKIWMWQREPDSMGTDSPELSRLGYGCISPCELSPFLRWPLAGLVGTGVVILFSNHQRPCEDNHWIAFWIEMSVFLLLLVFSSTEVLCP